MHYIGEFQQDSMILLELLTIDSKNQPIIIDFPPTATIEHDSGNGLQQVDSVTLETMGDGSTYTKNYSIPSNWQTGMYLVTYHVFVNGVEYMLQEQFTIVATPVIKTTEESVSVASGYIMPSELQIPYTTIKVNKNQIILTLAENLSYNYTYQVVLDQTIRSVTGITLEETKTVTFTSEYKALLSDLQDVHSIMRSTYAFFTPHEVYSAIRDASQKAFHMTGKMADPNSPRYRIWRTVDLTYFPATKFVSYEAARSLLNALLVRMLNGGEYDDQLTLPAGLQSIFGGSFQLGDFSVSDKNNYSLGLGGVPSGDKEETQLQKLQTLIHQIEQEMKFWQDSMMGHNKRGYAKPRSGSYRSASGSPTGRGLDA